MAANTSYERYICIHAAITPLSGMGHLTPPPWLFYTLSLSFSFIFTLRGPLFIYLSIYVHVYVFVVFFILWFHMPLYTIKYIRIPQMLFDDRPSLLVCNSGNSMAIRSMCTIIKYNIIATFALSNSNKKMGTFLVGKRHVWVCEPQFTNRTWRYNAMVHKRCTCTVQACAHHLQL